jgi:Tfp pilus assembly protein PilF
MSDVLTARAPGNRALARPARRQQGRESLYLATMLVPLVATLALAAGKVMLQTSPHLVQHAGVSALARPAQAATNPATPAPPTGTSDHPIAPAIAAAAAANSPGGSGAISLLLVQAGFWHDQGEPEKALESLNRVLAIEPGNADALVLAALAESERGEPQRAQVALTQLRRFAPGDRRIQATAQALRTGALPAEALAHARQLVRDGQSSEAIAAYAQLMQGGKAPASIAVEYYTLLAGTAEGWEAARDGLARTVRDNPQSLRAQLAYAEVLTHRDGAARADGITRLALLARAPAVGEQAQEAWRQALLGLQDGTDRADLLLAYLQQHPGDPAITAKVNNPIRRQAYDALTAKRLDLAADLFNKALGRSPDDIDALSGLALVRFRQGRLDEAAALYGKDIAANPGDADATGMLGIVRMHQRNFAAATALLNHAIELDPDRRATWQGALDTVATAGRWVPVVQQADPARGMIARGDLDGAERELRHQIARGGGAFWPRMMLADVLARRSKLGDAESAYRAALAGSPGNEAALLGLASVLGREGRHQEATDLLARAQTASTNANLDARLRAQVLREQAQGIADPASQEALYREAVQADPGNPWLCLELARTLVRLGREHDAQALMAQAVAGSASVDTLEAGIVFANGTSDAGAARSLIARLPPAATSAALHIARQEMAAPHDGLAGLAPTPQGLNPASVRADRDTRQPGETLAINAALLRRDPTNMLARRAAVGAALQLRDLARASALAQEGLTLAANDPRAWVNASDVDRADGQIGRALHELERARELQLQQIGTLRPAPPVDVAGTTPDQPQSPAVPVSDYPPRPFAVVALMDDSAASPVTPSSPRPEVLTAPLAPPATPVPAVSGADTAPYGQTSNPFRTPALVASSTDSANAATGTYPDAVTSEIDRSIAALREQVAPTMQVGFDFRDRSGAQGLAKLDEYSVPVEASFSPAGLGRMTLSATPTMIEAGRLKSGIGNVAQFGTGALGLSYSTTNYTITNTGTTPGDQRATGVGLDLAYQLNDLKGDIGATPIGFTENNIVGGVEWAPLLADRLRLRLTVERRAVDDSLLSYAGTTDARTGMKWGGVTRTGARANLEYSLGKMDFYAGGGVNMLDGQHVKDNNDVELGAGTSFPVWSNDTKEIRTGLDLVYFGYNRNLDYFTYGQGGYFSPQFFLAALVPLVFKDNVNDKLSYEIGGAVGPQTFRDKSSPLFPDDPSLQAALEASNVPGQSTFYAAQHETGVAGNVHAMIDYHVTPSLHLGARVSYAHAGNYDDTNASVFARYIFYGAY